MKQEKIAIIGFGKIGQAFADILDEKKEWCRTCGWDVVETKDPRQVGDIKEAKKDASIIILAIPSRHFGEGAKYLGEVDKNTILISATKGFDASTKKLPIEVLHDTYPKHASGIISGPMLSEELREGFPTRATLAGKNKKRLKEVQELFDGTNLTLEISEDWVGVSLFGILKNIYALATGLSDGLGLGSNFRSCVALQAIREIEEISKKLGGEEESFISYAGLSDFLTTAYSEKSRNYTHGFKHAKGEKSEHLAEGVVNIDHIAEKIESEKDLPLFKAIQDIFKNGEKEEKERIIKAVL